MRIHHLILFLVLFIIYGCKDDNCHDAVYYEMDYPYQNSLIDKSQVFDSIYERYNVAYKWIRNQNDLTNFFYLSGAKFKSETELSDNYNFDQYNLLAIVYFASCMNAKHTTELCDDRVIQFSHSEDSCAEQGMILRARLIQMPKGEYRIQFYGENI